MINGQPAKVGTTFNEKSVIRWSEERQAMKVIEKETNTRYLFVAKLVVSKEETPYEILTRKKHLSTHEGSETANKIQKLKMSLADEYELMDSVELRTELKIDNSHYFLATYEYGDTKLTKKLGNKGQDIIIDKSLFQVDGKNLEPRDITISLSYVDGNPKAPIFVKRYIDVTIIPEKID